MAKSNIEAHFPVVAVLELQKESLDAMERKMPEYFKGFSSLKFTEKSTYC